MRESEGRHDQHQRAQPPERDDQAAEKEQVVRAVEDVLEAQPDEAPGGLEPAGVERHDTWVAGELIGARRSPRQLVGQRRDDPGRKVDEAQTNREVRVGGPDRVLE